MNRSADVARTFCLIPVKRGDPFSCVHPTSINSLGKEAMVEEELEDKCISPACFWLFSVGGGRTAESQGEAEEEVQRERGRRAGVWSGARSSSDGIEEKADHKYA